MTEALSHQEDQPNKELLLNTRKELTFVFLVEKKCSATDVAFLLGYESEIPL